MEMPSVWCKIAFGTGGSYAQQAFEARLISATDFGSGKEVAHCLFLRQTLSV